MPGILENSDLGWPCPELSAMAGMSYSTPSPILAASNVRLPSTSYAAGVAEELCF